MILAKVNPKYIVLDHLRSLGIVKKGRRADQLDRDEGAIEDLTLFYIAPVVVGGVVAALLGWRLPGEAVSALSNTLSIFAPLLFNVLMLVFYMAREPEKQDFPEAQQGLIKEIYANTAYSIMVALFALLLLLMMGFWKNVIYIGVLSVGVLILVQNFALTLFMVLKRMYVLLERHM